jgi:hypothetical protein
MDKAKAGILYAGLIEKDEVAIAKLIDIPRPIALIRRICPHDLAAVIADATRASSIFSPS